MMILSFIGFIFEMVFTVLYIIWGTFKSTILNLLSWGLTIMIVIYLNDNYTFDFSYIFFGFFPVKGIIHGFLTAIYGEQKSS